ncbi:MAG TPA: aspartate--tRNA ligase [Candidatus Eisenbacteria bacterium]|nr:aspartate--tRNA ligase [Candidatus Eisenbacteria bacterium]
MLRTHNCGELTEKNIGQEVTLAGWIDTIRDHGGVTFIDLRDRYGKTQLVTPATGDYNTEFCIQVKGKVKARPAGTENRKIPTGLVEIEVGSITVLSRSEPLPFEVTKSTETNEELRLKYRYLDLRNPAVQKALFARHRIYQIIRRTFDAHGFIEVETPILTKSTPEGARDYLVPSRVNPGEFYALPQSPQLFKQILMVSGFDRYFQIAKCFRDEDLRADRQPEFTQLDMEMSFLEEDDLFAVIEEVMKAILKEVPGYELQTPFPRLSYQEAMTRYGTDKPDLRFDLPIVDVSGIARGCDFKVFREAASAEGGAVLGICLKGAQFSRKEIDDLTEFAKGEGALGLAYFKAEGGKLEAPIAKFFKPETVEEIRAKFGAADGDLVVFAADKLKKAQKILGAVRLHFARLKGLAKPGTFHFSWVTDFPLFQYDEEDGRWVSEHHPFTSPNKEDWDRYKKAGELGKIRSRAYDLVLNGSEIASGSVRIHSRDLQNEIFETIGLSPEEIKTRFGFLLGAFQFGTPPHGGLAFGIDRLVTIALGLDSIREVIAFPKNQKAVCPMTEAPSPVAEKQLKELNIKIR